MAGYRKLGRVSNQRIAILRNLATSLVVCPVKEDGKALAENRKHVVTTLARAKEVSKIIDKLVADAIREKDNFTTKEVTVSSAKLDSKGMKVLVSKTSKNGKKYEVVDREVAKKTVQVDNPSRLAARKNAAYWLRKSHDAEGHVVDPVNILYDEIAPALINHKGGYTKIVKLGARRGDASEMALLTFAE